MINDVTSRSLRPLRPLLPSATERAASPRNEPLPPVGILRDRVPSACEACRAKKIKCNGDRPICVECIKRSTSCHYATQSTETQGQALKRKYDVLRRENDVFAELFEFIRKSTDEESLELLRRIRTGADVEEVLRQIKEADLLIQLTEIRQPPINTAVPERIDLPDSLYSDPSSSGPLPDQTSYPTPDTPVDQPVL
jgi:hypothetical protein